MSSPISPAVEPYPVGIARAATIGSAAAILISIPASQTLLGIALVAILWARIPWRWPRVFLPLALFLGWMLVSLAFSPEPAVGLPQVKKLYVFLMLPVALAVLPRARDFLHVFGAWVAIAAASSLLALGQFAWKFATAAEQGRDFYEFYLGARITGFMSHWMTFSGQGMMVTLLLLSYLLFGQCRSRRVVVALMAALVLLLAGIVFGFTRGVWIATAVGAMPLLFAYRKWLAVAAPVAFLLLLAFGPASLQQRFLSIVRPSGELDSNQHRVVTFATGVEMIRAHPLLGLGPERVGAHVEEYAPQWIRRPFPEGYYGHLHNIYIHYGAERGLPAVLFLLGIFAVVMWHQLRALRLLRGEEPLRRALHLGVIAVTVAIMVGGLFEYNLGDSEILTMYLVTIAAGYAATSESAFRLAPAASEETHG